MIRGVMQFLCPGFKRDAARNVQAVSLLSRVILFACCSYLTYCAGSVLAGYRAML